jgi:hypothetical protein
VATIYKIHPAIGTARVGNSDEYYLAPETPGGLPLDPVSGKPILDLAAEHLVYNCRVRFRSGLACVKRTSVFGPQMGLSTDAVIKAALAALTKHLNKKAPSRRRKASSQGSQDLFGPQNS